MKLLIITQSVDTKDPVLGFFHQWIKELSTYCEKIIVICLKKGEYDLPDNVKIYSLGKEKQSSKWRYVINFYRYIWKFRNEYEKVFVHMNQEYIILGGIFWKLVRKKLFMWRNHSRGNIYTKIAMFFPKKTFCTSNFSYISKYKKNVIMPVGVDDKLFIRNELIEKIPNSVLFLGRYSPVKNPDLLIKALGVLKEKGIEFTASFFGTRSSKVENYYQSLKEKAKELKIGSNINFSNEATNTLEIFNKYELYVNLSESGSFDKTIFEAMGVKTLVLASNKSLIGHINDQLLFKEGDYLDLANKIEQIFKLSKDAKESYLDDNRNFLKNNHNLKLLIGKLYKEINNI